MNVVKRYTWEDSLIEAESLGLLPAGAVNMCLRLSKAITWEPKKDKAGKPSGLYWKNEDALKSVNSSKATYHRYREILFETGFFIEVKGNLIPQVPDLSQIETTKSQIETVQSQIETAESQIDSPYSGDTYSGNSSTVDEVSVKEEPVVADAPTASCLDIKEEAKEEYEYLGSLNLEDFPNLSLTYENLTYSYLANKEGVFAFANTLEKAPESQIETEQVGQRLAAEIRVTVARNAKLFGEDPKNDFWTEVTNLALDASFDPENKSAGSRVGKAQSEVVNKEKVSL